MHYIKALIKKPGALRNGKPFKDLEKHIPETFIKIREILGKSDEADREYAKILQLVLTNEADDLNAACEKALKVNILTADCIKYYLANKDTKFDYKIENSDYKTSNTDYKININIQGSDADCSYYTALYLRKDHE